ncbi:MAG: glycosyltransferase [Chloroflexota bacterium]
MNQDSSEHPVLPRRIAFISVHTCPLETPGKGKAGGMNVYLRQVGAELAACGVAVDIFTRSHYAGGELIQELVPGVRVIHLSAGSPELVRQEALPFLDEFASELAAFAADEGLTYDLVHAHYWLSMPVGQAIAAEWGVPHAITYHTVAAVKEAAGGDPEPSERAGLEREAAHQADGVVVLTGSEAADLSTLYDLPPDRFHIAPGGVDPRRFAPADRDGARRFLGLPVEGRVVLFVGRPEPFKGPEVLVRALALLPPAVHLLAMGGSDAEQSGEWFARIGAAAGVSERVVWRPAVPQEQLPVHYAAADLLAMPSRHETFGLAALEAMACARPVVAAAVGGLRSLVTSGLTGRLVDGHEPGPYAEAIGALLDDEALAARMGAQGRLRARRYSWRAAASHLLTGYAAIAEHHAGRGAREPRP